MSKLILFAGQSLAAEMFTMSSGTATPHADTHMWNGSGWVAPTGDGAITYANCLREALQEPIYLVNAAVGNTALISTWGGDYWSNPTGTLVSNAIARTQAALGSVTGLCLDRIEWWQGQQESYTLGGPANMFDVYTVALQALLTTLRTALGNGFRFCIWPVGKVHVGSTGPIIRAQMTLANGGAALGIEPGPASYDRGYRDGVHLGSAAEYMWMGIRGARNALSYFMAKANAAAGAPHYGAGPVIESLLRHPSGTLQTMFLCPRVKNGFCLIPGSQWPLSDTTWINGFTACWASGDHAIAPLTGAQLMGGWMKLYNNWTFTFPMWVSYQGERDCSVANVVYDTNQQWGDQGQPMLPLALGALTSG